MTFRLAAMFVAPFVLAGTTSAFAVERAHERPPGEQFRCTNRRFADFPDTAPGSLRAFDLRQGLDRA